MLERNESLPLEYGLGISKKLRELLSNNGRCALTGDLSPKESCVEAGPL